VTVIQRNTQTKPVERVETAYRETVLSTPHFEHEYSESYVENLRAEFGSDLASALHPESPAQFTPLLKQNILEATNQCIAARSALLKDIERELDSLRCSRSELFDILDEIDTGQHLEHGEITVADRLESVAIARQQVLHNHYSLQSLDGHHLHEYLYSTEPWDYPVLLALGKLREAEIRRDV
jgi:hypothetical protein